MKYWNLILFICLCLPLSAYNDHRNARVDSLEVALKSKHPLKGADLLDAYDELMRGYLPFDSEKAKYYGHKALALSYEQKNPQTRQYVLRHFGLLCYGSEDYDGALKYFAEALAVTDSMSQSGKYSQKDIDDAQSALYGSIANVYNLQGKAHLAIHYYQLALPLFERNGWLESQAVLYFNIGELYQTMGNDQEAVRNYLLAIEKGEASGDSLMIAMPQKGLAKVYLCQGKYEQARGMLTKCFAYYEAHRTEAPYDYATLLASMGSLQLKTGEIETARKYTQEALSLVSDEMMFQDQSEIFTACCEVAMAENRWKEALDYGLRSVRADSLATDDDANGYRLLTEIYIELGQREQARRMASRMYELMSRYATSHYQSGLSEMEVLYETEKKENQIQLLGSERKLYVWLLIGAGGVVVLLVLLLVYGYLAYHRRQALLAARVALNTETKERHILAHDLHDSLGGMLSLLRLKVEAHDDSALQLLDNTMIELRRVSHHLMPEELLRSGLTVALRDFAISIPDAHFQSIGDIALSKEQELVLYRCAYELVNNAMKHAKASHIDIQLMQEQREVTLTVSDNGQGMSDIENKGIGLKNIKERIAPYHGSMHIITNEGQGTEINVTLSL